MSREKKEHDLNASSASSGSNFSSRDGRPETSPFRPPSSDFPPRAAPPPSSPSPSLSPSRSSSPRSNACSRSSSPCSVLSYSLSPGQREECLRNSDASTPSSPSSSFSSRASASLRPLGLGDSPPEGRLPPLRGASSPLSLSRQESAAARPVSPLSRGATLSLATLASLSPPPLCSTKATHAPLAPSLAAPDASWGLSRVSRAADSPRFAAAPPPSSRDAPRLAKMESEDEGSPLFKNDHQHAGGRTRLVLPSKGAAAAEDASPQLSLETTPTSQGGAGGPGEGADGGGSGRLTPSPPPPPASGGASSTDGSPAAAAEAPRRLNNGEELDGPLPNELEMVIPRFRSRFVEGSEQPQAAEGEEGEGSNLDTLTLYSEWKELPALRFRLMIHPLTRSHSRPGVQLAAPVPVVPAPGRALSGAQQEYLQSRTTAAFVEIGRKPDWPSDWIFQTGVRFHIYVVNLTEPERSIWKEETFQFSCEETDRGWHAIVSYLTLFEERFFDSRSGDLLLRAAVFPAGTAVMSRSLRTPCPPSPPLARGVLPAKAAGGDEASAPPPSGKDGAETPQDASPAPPQTGLIDERMVKDEDQPPELGPVITSQAAPAAAPAPPASPLASLLATLPASSCLGRAGRGYMGLRNHGATCYMNALLQSLYYIGKFRQAVYALTFDTRAISGSRSIEVLEGRCKRRKRRAGSSSRADGDADRQGMQIEQEENQEKEEDMESSCDLQVEGQSGSRGAKTTCRDPSAGTRGGASFDASFSPSEHPLTSFLLNSDDEEDDFADWDERDMRDLLLEEEQEQRRPPSISLALQNLFFRLYTSTEPVACRELIRSFGWDAADAFTQQDTHELLKLLLDKVEEQMQGTPAEGSVKKMFEGEMETYIECIEVDYKSVRKETYEDLNLDVKGCAGIEESLRRLVQPEILEGENMYDAEAFGKQRARKGVRFLRFPPVCIFLLKRFDFDYERMDTVKVFSSFEFQRELDLNEFCPGAGVYELHAVSVHQGDVNSGHYYCFLRPPPRTQWVRFDDDKVYPVSEYAAIGDNFGGIEEDPCNYLAGRVPRVRQKVYNAYILVYVKKSLANQLLADCNPMKVNPQVVTRCRTEELLMKLRNRIRRVLEQRIKVKVYHPLQFLNRRFVDLPLATLPPLLELKSSRSVGILPIHEQITTRLFAKLYGAGESEGGRAAPPVAFLLFGMDFTTDDARFSTLEISENPTLGELFRAKMLNARGSRQFPGGSANANYPCSRFDACLYLLAVPETNAVVRSAPDHDEFCRRHQLIFLKYFDIFTANKGLGDARELEDATPGERPEEREAAEVVPEALRDANVICLDVLLVPSGWKLVCLQPHMYRRLLRCMEDGLVRPYMKDALRRYVASLGSLPPLFAVSASASASLFFPSAKGATDVDLSSSQSCSLAVCAAARGAGVSASLCGPVFLSAHGGVASAAGASREQAPDLPRDSALALTLALEIEFQDLKNPTSLTLSYKKTFSQEKIFPGDIFVFNIDAPESMRRRFQEIRRLAEVTGSEKEPTTTEEFGLSPSSVDGHDLLAQVYLEGKGLSNVPALLPQSLLSSVSVSASLVVSSPQTEHLLAEDSKRSSTASPGHMSGVSLSPSSPSSLPSAASLSSSPAGSAPTGAAAEAISTAARAALGDAGEKKGAGAGGEAASPDSRGDEETGAEGEPRGGKLPQARARQAAAAKGAEAAAEGDASAAAADPGASRHGETPDAESGRQGSLHGAAGAGGESRLQASPSSASLAEGEEGREGRASLLASSHPSLQAGGGGTGAEFGLLPFLPASRGGFIPSGPPEMPVLPSPDFHHYSLNKANRFTFQFRLYDPLEMLNRPMNCCGLLLEDYPRPSALPSFASGSSLPSVPRSQGSSMDTMTSFTLVSTSPSSSASAATEPFLPLAGKSGNALVLPAGAPSPLGSGAVAAGLQRSGSGVSGGGRDEGDGEGGEGDEDEDPWIHVPKGQPVAAKCVEVDVRVACNQVIRYVAWHMGVDPSRLFLFPEPPLLADASFEPVSLDSLVCAAAPANHAAGESAGARRADALSAAAATRRLSVNEVFSRLEKKALVCSGSRLGRRRPRGVGSGFGGPYSASPGTAGSRSRVFHLAVLPRHYSLCTRVIDPHALTLVQLDRVKRLVAAPAPRGAQASAPPEAALHDPLFHYVVLVFNRRAESLGCVEGVLPSRCPFSSRPLTVKDLIHTLLARMPPALRAQLADERRRATATGEPVPAGAAAPDSSRISDAALASSLRLVSSSAASLQELEKTHTVQSLPLYSTFASSLSLGGRQQRLAAGEGALTTQNLFAVPLRLELDWTPEEKDAIESGELKVLQVVHQTPTEREYFGYPFEILVRPNDTLSEIKRKVKEKLVLPKALWSNWTFFQYADCNRSWKGPNDRLDWQKYESVTLIAEHPAPYSKMRSQTAMRIA
ncbi:hypothetical protein BESB_020590 [Besnoitia besnoiti]|uniref:USP domain-containing protein n=1 Tax=Besnoitia besnoiti TaxID=94643 RepID=A0A2A9M0J5_BESBE|nr:hypothetical protein BESB_020590 [Besnoitia besnoiti]PFH32118.1 hypothetical protein BESB_020590 [Besnoitia besnoiti]